MTPRCPTCGNPTEDTSVNRFRPFCSRRCQLVDLGRWLDEDYVIPGEPAEVPERPAEERDER